MSPLSLLARRFRACSRPPASWSAVPASWRPAAPATADADLEIDAWPVGEPFALLPSLQSLTLRVILRAVFGYQPGHEEAELRQRRRPDLYPDPDRFRPERFLGPEAPDTHTWVPFGGGTAAAWGELCAHRDAGRALADP